MKKIALLCFLLCPLSSFGGFRDYLNQSDKLKKEGEILADAGNYAEAKKKFDKTFQTALSALDWAAKHPQAAADEMRREYSKALKNRSAMTTKGIRFRA